MRIDWEAVADLLVSALNPRLPEGTKLEARGTLLLFYDRLDWLGSGEIGLSHSDGIGNWRLEMEIDGILSSLQDVTY